MARPRKWADDRERRQAQSDTRRAVRQAHPVEFIGVDGEGTGKWRDRGTDVYLTSGSLMALADHLRDLAAQMLKREIEDPF